MMKKLTCLIWLSLSLAACGGFEETTVERVEYRLTGDAAVDASLPLLPRDELALTGLADGARTAGSLGVSVYGPLHDRRAVRGKGLSIAVYTATHPSTSWTLAWGAAPARLGNTIQLSNNGTGSFQLVLAVPEGYPDRLYFRLIDDAGVAHGEADGSAFVVRVYTRILSHAFARSYDYENRYAGHLTVNYSGPLGANDAPVTLHHGWNNWQNVADVPMTRIHTSAWYSVADYATAIIPIPHDAVYFDAAFSDGDAWDNNDGADFHTAVRPLVVASTSLGYDSTKWVSLVYANGTLTEPVFVRYGIDGWQNVAEAQLASAWYKGSSLGFHSVSLRTAPAARVLDLAFRDSRGNWENNFGMDWHLDIQQAGY
jgi:hypothetical protein